jgi:hypothetical protein
MACNGGGEGTRSAGIPIDERDASAKFAELRASEQYRAAIDEMEECLAVRGYAGNPYAEGITLPDGTVLQLGPGQPVPPLTGAYLDFRLAQQECQEEAGFEAILQQHGLTSEIQGVSPGQLAAMNEQQVGRMRCMEAKGWEIPEPVTLQGTLVFDVRHDNPEEESAWQADFAECWPAGGDTP